MAAEDATLEALLHDATNPTVRETNWTAIERFCQQVGKDEDPILAVRLLAHKVQSPVETEALHALTTLETCARCCGRKFEEEIGKFRFLNELIKVVSPKYMGEKTSAAVKTRIIELMYNWSQIMTEQPKMAEAYDMLKRQGIVTTDPSTGNLHEHGTPTPRPKNPVFDDDEKSKLLQKLLHSKNHEDLEAANRLIKSMVKESEKRMEKSAKRVYEIETVHNNVIVLNDMLTNYQKGSTSAEELELLKDLYQSCEGLRPNLFRLASDMDEKDDGLGEILKANDELVKVIEKYREVFDIVPATGGQAPVKSSTANTKTGNSLLLDLGSPISNTDLDIAKQNRPSSFLDDQLLALGLDDAVTSNKPPNSVTATLSDSSKLAGKTNDQSLLDDLVEVFPSTQIPLVVPVTSASNIDILLPKKITDSMQVLVEGSNVKKTVERVPKGFEGLDALGQTLLKKSLPLNVQPIKEFSKTQDKIPMNQMQKQVPPQVTVSTTTVIPPLVDPPVTLNRSLQSSPTHEVKSLTDIFVPVESIQPGSTAPYSIYNKNLVSVVIHFGRDSPRPDVSVMVVSVTSKNPTMVREVVFQAVVPKTMLLKLQPALMTELPAFNPILPQCAITQVMLIANPNKEKVKLTYKFSYILDGETHIDIGEVDDLPAT